MRETVADATRVTIVPEGAEEERSEGGTRAEESPAGDRPIGRAGGEVLALAFGGGGFDTALQLGVAHALVVSESRPPDAVAGISVGAIHAVALADVLQKGADSEAREQARRRSGLPIPEVRRRAQLKRLGELLEEFECSREVLLRATLPDAYEVNVAKALQPLRSPVHFPEEREHRREETEARMGLTRLLNHLLDIHLRVSTLTIAARRILGIRAAAEERSFLARERTRMGGEFWLYVLAWANLFRLAPIVGRLLLAVARGKPPDAEQTTAGSIVLWPWWRAFLRGLLYAIDVAVTALVLLLCIPFSVVHNLLRVPRFLYRETRDACASPRRRKRRAFWRRLADRFLRGYGILESLGRAHVMRATFVRLFDPGFYGRIGLDQAVEGALKRDG
ncbi:MAG TPA: patatin-like phospholipase family protein, partial [Planctomycetota bacterium]|nr:patatin-like phospholipase family protein [Planctomycetota bacterium]